MISTWMVNLILGRPNAHVLDAAVCIAAKFDAGVIGFAACRPIQTVCHDFAVPAVLFEEDRKEIERHVKAGELEFRHAVAKLKGCTEWRAHTTIFPLAEYLSCQARNADLVLVGTEHGQCDTTRRPDLCDFVMSVGRPVLLVPAGAAMNGLDSVVVAWKDTREARRAIVDALPFLKAATKTTIVEIADDEELPEARSAVAEVVSWLAHHGVRADAKVALPSRANASQLEAIACDWGPTCWSPGPMVTPGRASGFWAASRPSFSPAIVARSLPTRRGTEGSRAVARFSPGTLVRTSSVGDGLRRHGVGLRHYGRPTTATSSQSGSGTPGNVGFPRRTLGLGKPEACDSFTREGHCGPYPILRTDCAGGRWARVAQPRDCRAAGDADPGIAVLNALRQVQSRLDAHPIDGAQRGRTLRSTWGK
jgi:hypothetical protein